MITNDKQIGAVLLQQLNNAFSYLKESTIKWEKFIVYLY